MTGFAETGLVEESDIGAPATGDRAGAGAGVKAVSGISRRQSGSILVTSGRSGPRNSPPPLWGRTDSAEGRARRGASGIGLPIEPARRASAAGANPSNPSGPAPAADGVESRVGDGAPCPATPFSLGLRPSPD